MEWYIDLDIDSTIEQEGQKTTGEIRLILMYGDHPFVPPVGMNIDIRIGTDWDECLPVTSLLWSIRRGNLLIGVDSTPAIFTDLESFKRFLEELVGIRNLSSFTFIPGKGPLKEQSMSVFEEVSKDFSSELPW